MVKVSRWRGLTVFMVSGAWGCLPSHLGRSEDSAQFRSEASQAVTPPDCLLKNPHSLARPQLLKQQHQLRTQGFKYVRPLRVGVFDIPAIKEEYSVSATQILSKWSSYVFSFQGPLSQQGVSKDRQHTQPSDPGHDKYEGSGRDI